MEIADEGIMFLDEISAMPLEMQAKLLRVLEDRIIRRVGGTKEIKLDVQILTASNRDLPTMIRENKFREDLYYRLKVVDLHLPSLRERKEDIPEFVGLFIRHYNAKLGVNINGVTPKAMEALISYNWPGNIRELRNDIERATLFCDDPLIDLAHLPSEILSPCIPVPG
jgi:transcriptional regulator with PAS, ATPase and Fis domain